MSHDWLVDFYYWMPHLSYSIRNYLSLTVAAMTQSRGEANGIEESFLWMELLAEE